MAIKIKDTRYVKRLAKEVTPEELDNLKQAVESDYFLRRSIVADTKTKAKDFVYVATPETEAEFDAYWDGFLELYAKALLDTENYHIMVFADNKNDEEDLLLVDVYEKIDISPWGTPWVCRNPWRQFDTQGSKAYVNDKKFTKNYLYQMRIEGFSRFVWQCSLFSYEDEVTGLRVEEKSAEYEWLDNMMELNVDDVMAWNVVPNIFTTQYAVTLVPLDEVTKAEEKAAEEIEKQRLKDKFGL